MNGQFRCGGRLLGGGVLLAERVAGDDALAKTMAEMMKRMVDLGTDRAIVK